MPLYEYECQACGARFEKLVRSISQRPEHIACPACHSSDLQRLISAPAVHGGTASEGGGEVEESAPVTPRLFGRKELEAATKGKS
ncbi:MAG: zinc ribbon domain-containing protein [Anaerolineales bacterium]|nr:zinc ribbon domain-containing protein [Anaerolineales bacterium]